VVRKWFPPVSFQNYAVHTNKGAKTEKKNGNVLSCELQSNCTESVSIQFLEVFQQKQIVPKQLYYSTTPTKKKGHAVL
jgi:hypothetical protein